MLFIFLSGCVKFAEFYSGISMQPEMNEGDSERGLNVFGILKAGPSIDSLNYFFEVQQLIYVFGNYDSICVSEADISLSRKSEDGQISNFTLKSNGNCNYFNDDIIAEPGDSWEFTCEYDTFIVRANCLIPNEPKVTDINIDEGANQISFSIMKDSTACLYYSCLLSGEEFFFKEEISNKKGNTKFSLNPDWLIDGKSISLFVFAYDKNLEKYKTTSNIFFKPNAYRPGFSTVDGGYGVFGSMSSTFVEIK